MVDFFISLNPIYQAFIACCFTLILTVMGASCVFLVRRINDSIVCVFNSVSAGIMLASSIFSLIIPALDSAVGLGCNASVLLSCGFIIGSLFIYWFDIWYKKKNFDNKVNLNFVISMIIHNFPEGMAIGVAFASVFFDSSMGIMGAISLAIGIGIQNFPEGCAVSFPLYSNGYSKFKSFVIGGLSAVVEPVGGVIGVLIALRYPILLPLFLALAAGSMIYVIITELIPEVMMQKNKELMALYLIIGFIVMMVLDISLGWYLFI